MEGSGVCVACGAGGVELSDEQKCTNCSGQTAAPEAAPAAEAPAEAPAAAPEAAPAEGGDAPAA
jgi:hypothetical protein